MAYDKSHFDDPQTLARAIFEKKRKKFTLVGPDEVCDAFVSKYALEKAPWLNACKVYALSRQVQMYYDEHICYLIMLDIFKDVATDEGLRKYYGDVFPIERLRAWFYEEQYNQSLISGIRQIQAMVMVILLEFVVEFAEKGDSYPYGAAMSLKMYTLEERLYKLVYESQTIEDIEDFALTPDRCFRMTATGYLPFKYKANWMVGIEEEEIWDISSDYE